jgi:tRNA threonylcarbamoyladenosine biosynthesis protein TsaB
LSKNGATIICKEIAEIGFSHAEKLHVFIEEIIKESGINFSDLNAIAVSKGPGSYTGLRIGVSAAKGLCYALDIPLISIDTLKVLASQVAVENGLIIPMIDARRMEVYSAIFDSKLNLIRGVEAQILDENSFSEFDQPIYIIGDSSEKAKTILTNKNIVYLDKIQFPSANQMSRFSFDKFQKNDFEDVAYFEPFYLKDFLIATSKVGG